jgi:hypothetical protein
MFTNEYQFEFLTLDQQKSIIHAGEFIDIIKEEGYKILLYFCEKSYYVEVFIPEGEIEIDFICLASPVRKEKYAS